ncbi:beta-xylosidase [Rhizomicrobium palustre]
MRLQNILAGLAFVCGASFAAEPVKVTVDFSKPQGAFQPITNWFGYDESGYTLAPNGQALLKELSEAYSVPVYVRAHHLFTSGDGTADLKWSSTNIFTRDADGKPVYNFAIIDKIFDAWREAGVTPMVELGFMPEALSRKPSPYRIHFGEADMLSSGAQEPPTNYQEWGELVRVFTAHLVERYGAAEVGRWYFEVWNEPDIPYWHGTREEYFKLYDYAVAGVRAALPGAKVGGPATTSPRGQKGAAYLKAFLAHCAEEKSAADGKSVPLDFISFHAKGQPKLMADGNYVRMGLDKELADVREGFRIVAASPFAKLPIILSEADPEGCAACSAKENPANAYRNGPLYAAYTAASHKAMLDLAAEYQVNLISLLSWSFEFEGRGYFEGFRTLATNGIDKPVLNFFRMAGKLRGQRVAAESSGAISTDDILKNGVRGAPTVDVLATLDQGHAAVLLWNYHDDDRPGAAAEVALTLKGLPKGAKLLREYRIDEGHSNAYAAWQKMGSPDAPTTAQIAELKAAGGLHMVGRRVTAEGRYALPRSGLLLLVFGD